MSAEFKKYSWYTPIFTLETSYNVGQDVRTISQYT